MATVHESAASVPELPLTAFLLARIAEDEAEARGYLDDLNERPPSAYDMEQVGWIEAGSPERVLAECEAKRRIVELHQSDDPRLGICTTCHDYVAHDAITWPCPTLRAAGAVYADHSDYREEWRP